MHRISRWDPKEIKHLVVGVEGRCTGLPRRLDACAASSDSRWKRAAPNGMRTCSECANAQDAGARQLASANGSRLASRLLLNLASVPYVVLLR